MKKKTKMSFYVTLPSHANRREFPNNQANSFKIRLPQPLRLQGGGWQVGLSAISLPDTGVNIFNLLPADQFVFGTSCYRLTSSGRTVKSFNMKMEDLNQDDSIVDGVTFMKAFLQWVRQRMNYAYLNNYGAPNHGGAKPPPKWVMKCPVFWLIFNNFVTFHHFFTKLGNLIWVFVPNNLT